MKYLFKEINSGEAGECEKEYVNSDSIHIIICL